MKTLTDFALKEECKCLESVEDKLSEIDSLIDWKTFLIILESTYINKTVSGGRPETDVIVMFKCSFYNNGMSSLILNLRNCV